MKQAYARERQTERQIVSVVWLESKKKIFYRRKEMNICKIKNICNCRRVKKNPFKFTLDGKYTYGQ